MQSAILILFILLLFVLFLYSLVQLNLLYHFLKSRNISDSSEKFDLSKPEETPLVTIQLPIYNEGNVVARLLKNIAEIEYPKEKLEIQVLDDSTDESVAITAAIIDKLQQKDLSIFHLRRTNRKGYKAGALKEGLEVAKGKFIAIFDSDFLPQNDWLQKTLPYFKDEKLGVVQTRWGHLNGGYSFLTRLQAFILDFHFVLEQNGRNTGKYFINFNGTAGIWRKKCILDAGNWAGDTLTEDLDLSYRAQLKHWRFKYLEKVETPAELPITMAAARSQQFRWNKGAAENFQKNYSKIWKDSSLSPGTKIHSFFHLLNSSLFLVVLLLAILSVPTFFILNDHKNASFFIGFISFFSLGTLIFFISYWVSFSRGKQFNFRSFINYIGLFFGFFSVSMAFSVHNSLAVLEGHFGKKSEFIRTPKFNLAGNGKTLKKDRPNLKISFPLLLEICLMFYFLFAVLSAFALHNFSFLLLHLMLLSGFIYVVFNSIFDR